MWFHLSFNRVCTLCVAGGRWYNIQRFNSMELKKLIKLKIIIIFWLAIIANVCMSVREGAAGPNFWMVTRRRTSEDRTYLGHRLSWVLWSGCPLRLHVATYVPRRTPHYTWRLHVELHVWKQQRASIHHRVWSPKAYTCQMWVLHPCP